MTAADFDVQFNRLTAHFHMPSDASRDTLAMDWFKALQHHHVDALDAAVTELTRTATDRYWPALGRVTEIIRARVGRYDRTPGKCATCHGSTWIDAQPWKSNGMIYQGLQRCPDCGVPAPPSPDRRMTQGLTHQEFHALQSGETADYMPQGLGAKHPERPGNPEMREAMERLRRKLFGVTEEVA